MIEPDLPRAAPALWLAPFRELRALREPLRLAAARRRLRESQDGDGGPLIVFPGMHVGDWTTAPLRRFLRRHGWDARGWRLGFHRADVTATLPHALARVEQLAVERGMPVAIIGWSLGGIVAREVARLRPDLVLGLVTLGTPVIGGVRFVAVSYPYRRRGWSLETIEQLADDAARVPLRVPLTVIWSRRDGIVAGAACVDRTTPQSVHVEVQSSHWGLGLDPDVWTAVTGALASLVATRVPMEEPSHDAATTRRA